MKYSKSGVIILFCLWPKTLILFYLATLKLSFLSCLVILNAIIFFLARFGDPFSKVGDPKKDYNPYIENNCFKVN